MIVTHRGDPLIPWCFWRRDPKITGFFAPITRIVKIQGLAEGIAGLVGAIAFKISDEFVGRFSGLELILWNGVKVSDGCVDATEPQ
jgi:hypothetical protein